MKSVYEKLNEVQTLLKAPKGQFNKFGNYKYRSCEDILEAVKPILKEVGAVITLQDEIKVIGDRFYVEACARFIDAVTGAEVVTKAYAREEAVKKGMDGSQVTGSSSSYARKYCLNGLLLIDDTKDEDSNELKEQKEAKKNEEKQKQNQDAEYVPSEAEVEELRKQMYRDPSLPKVEKEPVQQIPPYKMVKENQVEWLIKENNLKSKEEITADMVNQLMTMLNQARKGK